MQISEFKDCGSDQVEGILVDLFSTANENVRMSAGLYPDFYRREKIQNAITQAAKKVEWFELLLDFDVDVNNLRAKLPWLFQLQKEGEITIMKSDVKIPHWIIVDEKNFRLEKEHLSTEAGKSNLVIKDADKPYIHDIVSIFDGLWDNAHQIDNA